MKMKFTVKTAKPRNPWVAASYRAAAGLHRPTRQARCEQRSMREELARLDHERHHT